MPELTLHLLDEPRTLTIEELEPVASPHTGVALRQVEAVVVVPSHLRNDLNDALNSARQTDDALVADDGSRWIVSGSSHSYNSDEGPSNHTFQLRESEILEPTTLEFGGFSLQPRRYSEMADGDDRHLAIRVRVDLDAAISERLEEFYGASVWTDQADDYFELVRRGIDDSPLRVRFGRCLWEPVESGRAYILNFFSEREEVDASFRGFSEPELGNTKRLAVATSEMLEALLEELGASGVLEEAALARVRGRAADAFQRRWREFDRVRAIDEWWT